MSDKLVVFWRIAEKADPTDALDIAKHYLGEAIEDYARLRQLHGRTELLCKKMVADGNMHEFKEDEDRLCVWHCPGWVDYR